MNCDVSEQVFVYKTELSVLLPHAHHDLFSLVHRKRCITVLYASFRNVVRIEVPVQSRCVGILFAVFCHDVLYELRQFLVETRKGISRLLLIRKTTNKINATIDVGLDKLYFGGVIVQVGQKNDRHDEHDEDVDERYVSISVFRRHCFFRLAWISPIRRFALQLADNSYSAVVILSNKSLLPVKKPIRKLYSIMVDFSNRNLDGGGDASFTPGTNISPANNASLIWYKDPAGFMRDANAAYFIPSKDAPLEDQLNAVMRFAIYFTLVLLIIKRDINLLFIVIVVGAATYVINESNVSDERHKQRTMEHLKLAQDKDGQICTRPTKDNPFMNVTLEDLREFPNRPKACDITHKQVQKEVEDAHDFNLFRDVDDVYGRKTSSRQFYTMPNTTVPDDRTAFAEWLYKTGPTCKEGNGLQCHQNQLRAIPL